MPWKPLPFPLPPVPPRFHGETLEQETKVFSRKLFDTFFSWPIERSIRILETTPEEVWQREGEKRALYVFHEAARRVPAYKDFLKKQRITPNKVRTIKDFEVVPWIDKKNYLRQYSLADLSWDGLLHTNQMISVSSGSSGEPFFWPRGALSEIETTYIFELVYKEFFQIDKNSTLIVVCAAMGMYVGGPITLNCSLRIASKGHQLTIVTPGYVLDDILRIVSNVGNQHNQLIFVGYPPLIKEILDEGSARGIEWRNFKLKFVLAGEGFNETWREYVSQLAGGSDLYWDMVNWYGTADAAVLGHESPYAVSLRRAISTKPKTLREIFGEDREPSFMHYYPTLRFFEVLNRELIFTTSGGLPLVRYNIHDSGGIFSNSAISKKMSDLGISRDDKPSPLRSYRSWYLPFVYLHGRSDFTAFLYGANIYPENIRAALENPKLRRSVTTRFTMSVEPTRRQDQRLVVNIECAKGTTLSRSLQRQVRSILIETLELLNSEYRVVHKALGKKAVPTVHLYPKGDTRYFRPGIKHRWIQKRL